MLLYVLVCNFVFDVILTPFWGSVRRFYGSNKELDTNQVQG